MHIDNDKQTEESLYCAQFETIKCIHTPQVLLLDHILVDRVGIVLHREAHLVDPWELRIIGGDKKTLCLITEGVGPNFTEPIDTIPVNPCCCLVDLKCN